MSKTLDPETTEPDEVADADVKVLLRTLSDELEADNLGVSVEETPIGTKVGVKTNTGKGSRFTALEVRMAREFVARYEDLLVGLYELDAEGVDLWWAIGEKMDEHGLDDVTYAWMDVFADPVGLDAKDFKFADRIHRLYGDKADIPQENYSDETFIGRLAQYADDGEEARRVIDAFDDPSKRDVRLWKEFRGTAGPDVEAVVAEAQRRFKAKYGYSDGTWVKKTQTTFEALGDDVPTRDEVESAIDTLADE